MNLNTLKAATKYELLFRGWFVEHLSQTQVAQHSETQIVSLTFVNLVTPKAGAKLELSWS